MKNLYSFISFIIMDDAERDKRAPKDMPPDMRENDDQTWDVGGKAAYFANRMWNRVSDNIFAHASLLYF